MVGRMLALPRARDIALRRAARATPDRHHEPARVHAPRHTPRLRQGAGNRSRPCLDTTLQGDQRYARHRRDVVSLNSPDRHECLAPTTLAPHWRRGSARHRGLSTDAPMRWPSDPVVLRRHPDLGRRPAGPCHRQHRHRRRRGQRRRRPTLAGQGRRPGALRSQEHRKEPRSNVARPCRRRLMAARRHRAASGPSF